MKYKKVCRKSTWNVYLNVLKMLPRRVFYNSVCSKTYALLVCSDSHNLKSSFSSTGDDVSLVDKISINTEKKRGGFAQAFERYTSPPEIKTQTPEKEETFASLLRTSKFIDVIILCNGKMYEYNSNVSGTAR